MEPFLSVLVGSISSNQAARNALAETFVVRRPLRYAHLLPLSDLDGENRSACPGRGVILTLRYDDRRGGAWTISDWGTAPAPTTINGSVTSTDTRLGPFTLFYSVPVDFAFLGTPPGNAGASRLIVGDAANGDSILTCLIGNNPGSCANGDFHVVETDTIIGGTGRYAGARGSFTMDRCVNLVTGDTSGTISGTIVVIGQ